MRRFLALLGVFIIIAPAAALGPANVLIVVNKRDPVSLAVANHYRLRRQIPGRNFVFVDYTGNTKECSWEQFKKEVYDPTLATIARENIENQISVWLTMPGLPYRVGKNGISGVVHFGQESTPVQSAALGPAGFTTANAYYDAHQAIIPPQPGQPKRYLHMFLPAESIDAGKAFIDRSFSADAKRPKGTIYLFDGDGPRASRQISIPMAARMLDLLDAQHQHRPSSSMTGVRDVLGVYTGAVSFPCAQNTFLPGAIADHLTSFGGALLDSGDQMSCLEFLKAGCVASYGTVVEPYSYPAKFPSAQAHVLYFQGFSAIESYWMSVYWPQQSVFVGDPLARPFGIPPTLRIDNVKDGQQISGDFELAATADAAGDPIGVSHIELFLDDRLVAIQNAGVVPAGAKVELVVGGQTYSHQTAANCLGRDLILGLAKTAAAAPDLMVQVRGGDLWVLSAANLGDKLTVQARSSTPQFQAVALKDRFQPGNTGRELVALWGLNGAAGKDDLLRLTLEEEGQKLTTVEFRAAEELAADKLAAKLTAELQKQLPQQYQLRVVNPNAQQKAAALVISTVAAKLTKSPKAMLDLVRAGASNLQASNLGKQVPLADPTFQAYALAWVRFGVGAAKLPMKVKLPTAQLPDGRHVVRVVAHRGSASMPQATALASVVIRNQAATLRLTPAAAKLTSKQDPAAVAAAALSTPAGSAMEFFVDGRSAQKIEQPPFQLKLGPKDWGLGQHEITARVRLQNGRELFSDNMLTIEIVP